METLSNALPLTACTQPTTTPRHAPARTSIHHSIIAHHSPLRQTEVAQSSMPSGLCSMTLVLLLVMTSYGRRLSPEARHRRDKCCRESYPKGISDEQKLYYKLMKNYEKSVRPILNSSLPVVVKLGITLTQIFDMDEKNQVLTVNVWLDQEWIDDKLKWDPDQFGGIKVLRVPCDRLWLPDLVLYNSVDDYTETYMRSLAMVTFDGNVFWPPIVRFRSACKVDITYFPFDDQICSMKMGSWAYDGFQLDVTNRSSSVDLSNYVDNGEWELVAVKNIRKVKYYACCPEPFPDVTFWFHMRRRTTYYTFNVIIPCVILSILTLASFMLPAESGEKVTLGLTVLLAFSVFMLLIAENMPATSEFVPLIGLYLTVTMAMTSMSVVFSVFVLHIYHHGGRGTRAPRWLRLIALKYLKRVVRVHTQTALQWFEELEELHTKIHPGFGSFNDGFKGSPQKNIYRVENGQLHLHMNSSENKEVERLAQMYQHTEQQLIKYLRYVIDRQEKDEVSRYVIKEWHDIAVVFDHMLFWMFSTVTFTSSVALLVFRPMAKDMSLDS